MVLLLASLFTLLFAMEWSESGLGKLAAPKPAVAAKPAVAVPTTGPVVCTAENGDVNSESVLEQFIVSLPADMQAHTEEIVGGVHHGSEITPASAPTLDAKLAACDTTFAAANMGWPRQGCKFAVISKWGFCNAESTVGQAAATGGACPAASEFAIGAAREVAADAPATKQHKADFRSGVEAAMALTPAPTGPLSERLAQCQTLTPPPNAQKARGCAQYLTSVFDICENGTPTAPANSSPTGTLGTRVGVSNQTATKTGIFFIVAGLLATSVWMCGMSTNKKFYTSLVDEAAGEI